MIFPRKNIVLSNYVMNEKILEFYITMYVLSSPCSLVAKYPTSWLGKYRRLQLEGFEIETAKLIRGRCFPFIDKRVGRIIGVAIFESFFLFHNNLFQFRQFFDLTQ